MNLSELKLEEKLTGLKDLDVPNLKMGEVERLPAVSGGAEGGGDGGGRLPRRIALITAVLALAIAGCDDGKSRKESAQEKWDKIRAKRSATTDYPAETEDPEFRVAGDEPKVLGKKEDEDGSEDDPLDGNDGLVEDRLKAGGLKLSEVSPVSVEPVARAGSEVVSQPEPLPSPSPTPVLENKVVVYSANACGEVSLTKLSEINVLNARLEKELSNRKLIKGSVKLGEDGERVFRYEYYKDLLTPQEYYDYVSSLVESPEDIVKVLRPLVDYQYQSMMTHPRDTLVDEGDCVSQSALAKYLLRDLACREGGDHDYQAKVLGIDDPDDHMGHSVCVFVGRDEKRYVIDQERPLKSFEDFVDCSKHFEKFRGKDYMIHEWVLGPRGEEYYFHVDSKDFERFGGGRLSITFPAGVSSLKDFDVGTGLAIDLKGYSKVQIKFEGEGYAFYDGDVLISKQYDTNLSEFFDRETGKLVQIDYPEGTKDYFDEDGNLQAKRGLDGVTTFFNVQTGKVKQRTYANGKILIYGSSGEVLIEKWEMRSSKAMPVAR